MSPWGRRLAWAAAALAAAIGGALSARPAIQALAEHGAIRNGPWTTMAATGSAHANPYERAAVAVAGIYALSQDEAVYFTAFTDDSGTPLSGSCAYRVHGAPPAARWWSVTLYGADHFLVANDARIHSRHQGNLALDADGHFAIEVAAQPQGADAWLPAPAGAPFSLTLRLYNPAPALARDLAAAELPAIERSACR
ncbi:MAG TPA: DUF1214 domain-containing protein [Candidatus Binatia bacterium]|nr:DUF1214 domain-containing protein [Candidatus Binatia bacterium]